MTLPLPLQSGTGDAEHGDGLGWRGGHGNRERHAVGGAVCHGEVGDGGRERYVVGGAVCHGEVGDDDCEQHTAMVSIARCSSKQGGEREGSIFNKDN